MKKFGVWIIFSLWFCSGCGQGPMHSMSGKKECLPDSLTSAVFRVEGGWGYEIIKNGKVLIYQPFIPVIEGRIPFRDSNDALITALCVIEKIRKNKIPPALTHFELDSMEVIPSESALTKKP